MKKRFGIIFEIVLLVLCLLLIGGCSRGSENNYDFGYVAEEFSWKYNFGMTEGEIVEWADAICDGNIYVDSTITEPYVCDFKAIDWDVTFSKSPGTFMLYLQALNPISYLTQAYYINGDIKYLDAGRDLIEQWIEYKEDAQSESNPYLWYDHGTAIRSNNLIYFLLAYVEKEDYDRAFCQDIIVLLNEHGEHLANEEEYYANHNHGIFQDQALLHLAYFLNNEKSERWIEIALTRLESQVEYAFSEEMVHVENSPAYQKGITELFYEIAQFLEERGEEYGNDLQADVERSLEYMTWVTKPNGGLAEIGDTVSIRELKKKDYSMEKFGNSYLTWASTLGEKGEKPSELSAIYPKSGYYYGRNSWEKDDYTSATWVMFKAGYLSKTHKHADDLSFMLYSKGYDVFVDSGWYNYMAGDPYRDYFVSARAHNGVLVDEKSYSATEENSYKTGIFSYNLGENWDEVIAYNNMYDGVQIDRHFFYGGDVIILVDEIESDTEHEYSQLFHLSEYMELEEADDYEVVAKIGDSGYKVRIQQLGTVPTLNVINGNDKNVYYGYLSRAMNEVEPVNTLKYDITGTNVTFVTLITIENANGEVMVGKGKDLYRFDSVSYLPNLQEIVFLNEATGLDITWEKRNRPLFDKVKVEIGEDSIHLQNNTENADLWEYAWYLVDMKGAEVLEKTSYSGSNVVDFQVVEDGSYIVKAYMRAKEGNERTSSIVAAIKKERDEIIDITSDTPYLNLEYIGHTVEKVSEDTYRFEVMYNYFWNTEIAWYIYKDGGSYGYEQTNNSNSLEYHFTESGNYTILYYLRTPNGDNEFWNFSQIQIE